MNNIKQYEDLIDRYKKFLEDWYKKDIAEASRFNLFSILKINWKEVLVHTPFLAELLNPHGTHSQGALFYKEFIRITLPKKDHLIFENIDTKCLYVKDEERIKNGCIDIFIHHKDKLNSFIIVIENKIYAGDQYEQIKKYYDHARINFGITPDRIRILYLKPFEALPSDESIEKAEKEKLIKDGILIPISYYTHIINWLKQCEKEVHADVVNMSIKQYLLTLESICYE